MKFKNLVLLLSVFITFFYTLTAQSASPISAWTDSSINSQIQVTTMLPDSTISGGGLASKMLAGDVNCDGYEDLIVSTSATLKGKVYIHLGNAQASFPNQFTQSQYVVTGRTNQLLYASTLVGDLDGDSCPEIVLTGTRTSTGASANTFYLYYSSTINSWATDGVSDTSYTYTDADSYISMSATALTYYTVHNLGNIDGVAQGEHLGICSDNTNKCYLMPVSALVAGTGTVESNAPFFIGSAGADEALKSGDFDGDGVDDLLIGSSANAADNVAIVYGPISDRAGTTFNSAGYFETTVAPALGDGLAIFNTNGHNGIGGDVGVIDLDQDGKDEFYFTYMSTSNRGFFYVVSGVDSLINTTNSISFDPGTGSFVYAGLDVALYQGEQNAYLGYDKNSMIADFNGDGYDDFYFGGQNYMSGTVKGRGYLLYNNQGGTSFVDDLGSTITLSSTSGAVAYVEGSANSDQFSSSVTAGDFDGDGDDELVAMAVVPGSNRGYGEVSVIVFPDDVDGDGVDAKAGDCDDIDASTSAPTTWYTDSDADGYGDVASSVTACTQPAMTVSNSNDCDDTSAQVNPTTVWYVDADGDGFGGTQTQASCTQPTGYVSNSSDCNDSNASLTPNTVWYQDADGDGFGGTQTQTSCTQPTGYVGTSTDCNDSNASLSAQSTWYRDADADGYGSASTTTLACGQPTGYVSNSSDCNDSNASLTPNTVWYQDADGDGFGGTQTQTSCTQPTGYVGTSTDCNDSNASLSAQSTWYRDADADGYGSASTTTLACGQPTGYVSNSSDCNDSNASLTPNTVWYQDADGDGFGGTQTQTSCTQPTGYVSTSTDCNDASASITPTTVWYADADGDGFGSASTTQLACTQPAGYVANATDCNDSDSTLTPNTVWYQDADGDGFGGSQTQTSCTQPTGYVSNNGDCNDASASIMPTTVWYADADGDGFGSASTTQLACTQPAGYVANATDCNDSDSTLTLNTVWYQDADGDGFGGTQTQTSCTQPAGYVNSSTDTDDTSSAVYPGAVEVCTDGLDNDSNGLIDSADSVCQSQVSDADADGYTTADGDCDDNEVLSYPGATEVGDAIDNDCDGSVDEGLLSVTIDKASVPQIVSQGDTFTLDVNVGNNTGLSDLEVEVLLPHDALTSSSSSRFNVAPTNVFKKMYCNSQGTNCEEVGVATDSITAGTSGTISVPVTVPSNTASGQYVVRVRVLDANTGQVLGYFKNPLMTANKVLLNIQ